MFDFCKTVICGAGKAVVGTLAVIGGIFMGALFLDKNFAENMGEAVSKTLNAEDEGD